MRPLAEKQHGTGAIRSSVDKRDFDFHEIAGAVAPFDWDKGYDVEKELGIKLVIKNQGESSSCGGQAWAYYGEVLSTLFDKSYDQKSAKFIYAQTFVFPSGGSAGRDNCKIVKEQGWANEAVLSSYDNGEPPTEAFMERINDITDITRANAKKDKAISYATVSTDIESVAEAIQNNHGCIIGIQGQNNGTWRSVYPATTNLSSGGIWAHWLYAGKCKKIGDVRYIGVCNSWGEDVGDKGWQWINENFFKDFVFEAWTIMFNPNKIDTGFKHGFFQDMTFTQQSNEIKNLQTALQILGYFPHGIPPTGYYGELTRQAVYKFQVDNKVAPVWILWFNKGMYCWSATRGALNNLFN